jgi:hypothetical protein
MRTLDVFRAPMGALEPWDWSPMQRQGDTRELQGRPGTEFTFGDLQRKCRIRRSIGVKPMSALFADYSGKFSQLFCMALESAPDALNRHSEGNNTEDMLLR